MIYWVQLELSFTYGLLYWVIHRGICKQTVAIQQRKMTLPPPAVFNGQELLTYAWSLCDPSFWILKFFKKCLLFYNIPCNIFKSHSQIYWSIIYIILAHSFIGIIWWAWLMSIYLNNAVIQIFHSLESFLLHLLINLLYIIWYIYNSTFWNYHLFVLYLNSQQLESYKKWILY